MNLKTITIMIFMSMTNITTATIWVGGDANCDYDSIQPALDALLLQSTEFDLNIANNNTDNGVYTENINMVVNREEQVRIEGGYDQCFGNLTEVRTEINGGGIAPVMNISGDDSEASILISNLLLTDGLFDNNLWAGGLNIDDNNLEIRLFDVSILNNQGHFGGGIYSKGTELLNITMYRTLVANNTAEYGGGIYCLNNQQITIRNDSGVSYNTATSSSQFAGHGGGIYMDNGCNIRMSSGNVGTTNLSGIVGNTATGDGGGTYVTNSSFLELRQRVSTDKYVVYSDNIADSDHSEGGSGGAIYITGTNSFVTTNGKGILIENNVAADGGAIALHDGATGFIRSIDNSGCKMQNPCISFSGNSALKSPDGIGQGLGGTFYIDDASLSVSRAEITESQADVGIVGFVTNGTLDMSFNTIHKNGATPNAQFNQNNLLNAIAGRLILSHVTLVDNVINASQSILFAFNNGIIQANNNIIQGGNNPTFEGFNLPGVMNDIEFRCNVMHEDNSIGNTVNISDNTVTTTPGFVDSTQQDYRLALGSVAIDKCASIITSPFTQVDLEGQLTGIDDPNKIDELGTFDAGADESYLWDVIFENGFD